MLRLLILVPILALCDPWLLYLLWAKIPLWLAFVILIAYPLAATVTIRFKTLDEHDPLEMPLKISRLVTRILAWYPGPISKFLSLLMLIPAVERAVANFAWREIHRRLLKGLDLGALAAQFNPSARSRSAPKDSSAAKPAKGRVVK